MTEQTTPRTEQTGLAVTAPASGSFGLTPANIDEAIRFAEMLAKSTIVPKDFIGNPGNILVAMQWGAEIGLKPMQALQNIAVINGRPSLWGDAVMALVRASPLCEYIYESDDGQTATCRVKRRGEDEQCRTFSQDDARQAQLAGKSGPWTQYPKRMRQLRARALACRDVFADVMRGLAMAEEAMDIPPREKDLGRAVQAQPPALPASYPAADFARNLPKWQAAIASGKRRPEEIIAMVQTKGALSDAQQAQIHALAQAALAEHEALDADIVAQEAQAA